MDQEIHENVEGHTQLVLQVVLLPEEFAVHLVKLLQEHVKHHIDWL